MIKLSNAFIEQQKLTWTTNLETLNRQIEELARELTQKEQQKLILAGAIRACDVFAQALEADKTTDSLAKPSDALTPDIVN